MGQTCGLWAALDAAMKWSMRRRFRRAHAPARLRDTRDGTTVRITGTIVEQPTMPSLFGGVPAVLFRSRIGAADETRGHDFWLQLDDGDQARIGVRGAILLDPLQRAREPAACGPVTGEWFTRGARLLPAVPGEKGSSRPRHEATVGPGDRVDVCGVLHHEAADPAGPFERQVEVHSVLRADKGIPLLVRRI